MSMRLRDILAEAVTRRPWTFYHGTNSEGFDRFEPSLAAKGKQYWNPLGDGMYVTNNPRFAYDFGSKVYKIVIPAGSTYKRINSNLWHQIGPGMCVKALKRAFKEIGDSYDAWEHGSKQPEPFNVAKLDRDALERNCFSAYKERNTEESEDDYKKVLARIPTLEDNQLRDYLKDYLRMRPRIRDDSKSKKIMQFRTELDRTLIRNDPYTGLYESLYVVLDTFKNEKLTDAYSDILPQISNEKFGKFDFVVFTETNDPLVFNDKESTSEVVIFNPALQKTSELHKHSRYTYM